MSFDFMIVLYRFTSDCAPLHLCVEKSVTLSLLKFFSFPMRSVIFSNCFLAIFYTIIHGNLASNYEIIFFNAKRSFFCTLFAAQVLPKSKWGSFFVTFFSKMFILII